MKKKQKEPIIPIQAPNVSVPYSEDTSMDELFKKIEESAKAYNEFNNAVKHSLNELSSENFGKAHEVYKAYLEKTSTPDSNIKIQSIKYTSTCIIEFIKCKDFDEEKTLDYLKVIKQIIRPKLFAFLLWTQDKRDACFNIFRNETVELTEKEYDACTNVIEPHKENRNLPLNLSEKQEYLDKQREEYFFYQLKYALIEELKNLPQKEEKPKRIKI